MTTVLENASIKRMIKVICAIVFATILLFGCDGGGSSDYAREDNNVYDDNGTYNPGHEDDDDGSHNQEEFVVIPTSPKNVKAVATDTYSIKVSWDTVDNADYYIVYYRPSTVSVSLGTSDDFKKHGTELKKTTYNTSILITSLEYKTYLFWVTAKNSAGESFSDICDALELPNMNSSGSSSGSGGSSSTTTSISAPTGLIATATGPLSVSLSWNSVKGATRYYIYKSEYSSSFSASVCSNSPSTSATVTGLNADTTYYFWVKAYDGSKLSDFSLSAKVSTPSFNAQNPSYGILKIINNSSYTIKNLTLYTEDYDWSSLSGMETVNCTIRAGSVETISNVYPGYYVEIGSKTYANHKVSTNKIVNVKSGLTTTLTITDADIISN